MFLGVVLAVTVIVLVVRFAIPRVSQQQPVVPEQPPVLSAEKNIVDSMDRERRSMNRVKLQAAALELKEAQAALAGLKQQLEAWDTEVLALMNNDEGRRLAADDGLVEKFAASFRKEDLWTVAQLEAAEARLKLLMIPVEEATKENTGDYAPSADWSAQVEREQQALTTAAKAYMDLRQVIITTLRSAPQAPAQITLQEALDRLDSRLAQERAEVIETAVRDEHQRKTEELAKAEAERARTAAEQQVAQVESARLRALAQDAAVQAKYQPFLAKGRFLINHPDILGFSSKHLFIDGPAELPSYNDLVRCGATRDLKTFIAIGIGKSKFYGPYTKGRRYFERNDRPLWTTAYPQTDAQWAEYRKLFEEFQQLAPVWRDMGLLRP
ncbi:MAG: hypothetical protein KF841_03075 [Phycisphaerae bacterium]|nr:hypothetical protein [Phycisphaerae bacterium]